MQTHTCAHSQRLLRGLFFRDAYVPSAPGFLDGSFEKKAVKGMCMCVQSQCNFFLKLCISTTPTSRRSPIQAYFSWFFHFLAFFPATVPGSLHTAREVTGLQVSFTAFSPRCYLSIHDITFISLWISIIVTNHKGTIWEAPTLLVDASPQYELLLMPVSTQTDMSTELLSYPWSANMHLEVLTY